jgi:hypothetical protein
MPGIIIIIIIIAGARAAGRQAGRQAGRARGGGRTSAQGAVDSLGPDAGARPLGRPARQQRGGSGGLLLLPRPLQPPQFGGELVHVLHASDCTHRRRRRPHTISQLASSAAGPQQQLATVL